MTLNFSVLDPKKETNKIFEQDLAAHDWYRFVLSYPPHLVRNYLEKFEITTSSKVLDPFCGTGTTLVECKKQGVESFGIESNPIAHFASSVKLDWSIKSEVFLEHSNFIAAKTLRRLEKEGFLEDFDMPLFSSSVNARSNGNAVSLKTLSDDEQKLILRDSISPIPLHKVLTLLEEIKKNADSRFVNHQLLALAKAIVFEISNLRFGPEVGVGIIKKDVSVVSAWQNNIKKIANDLNIVGIRKNCKSFVFKGDARIAAQFFKPKTIDAVITSPPYPNEKDYTRTTRLESVLLGFIQSKKDLRETKEGLLRSNTRNVFIRDEDDKYVSKNEKINSLADAIEKKRIELGKTSGFEKMYARVVRQYFGGMAKHLADIRPILKNGACLAYVVGDQASYFRVLIKTGEILAEVAESLGYEVVGIDLFRTRRSTVTKQSLREEVVVLRWSP